MAGKFRSSQKVGVTRMVRLPTTSALLEQIEKLAEQEQRSIGNMVHVLVREALIARKLLRNTLR
jgi:hypothetical protein